MIDAADGIDAPPRAVRLRDCLKRWWPLGVGAGVGLLLCTGYLVVRLALEGGALPFEDLALDSGASRADAEVVASTPETPGSGSLQTISYRFRTGAGPELRGTCWVPINRQWPGRAGSVGMFEVGGAATVEYLEDDPNVNRLVGGKRARSAYWLVPHFVFIWAPLFIALLVWLRAVLRFRIQAREGATGVQP